MYVCAKWEWYLHSFIFLKNNNKKNHSREDNNTADIYTAAQ